MIVTSAPGGTTEQMAISASAFPLFAPPPLEKAAPASAVSVRVVPLELRSHPASAFGD